MSLGPQKKSEIKYHLNVEEYIPYAAHYDEETVITKNGELMQVIKITGYEFENLGKGNEENIPLRKLVREAIKNSINSENFAVWIHTMRRHSDISMKGVYENPFSKALHESWVEKNKWRNQFVNELYISILVEGEELSIRNPKHFLESIFIEKEVRNRKVTLAENARKLNDVTGKILETLKDFGARKLSIFKKDGIYHSEIVSFASKIMNLKQEDIPFGAADLSTTLPTHKVEFQYNIVQVEGITGKHFGAVFTVKEFHEVMLDEIDKFLQLPIHFIISECFDFINRDKALEAFKDQKKIFDLSGSKTMMDLSGIQEIIDSDNNTPTDFGEHCIVITVIEDSIKGMLKAVSQAVDSLRDIGVVFIREDLLMENCYWSMLPGNFDFIARQNNIPSHKLGGYASLYNFPAGRMMENHWGEAVTVLKTKNNTPYFFNFHFGANGHTLMIGPENSGKTVLTNFLVSEAQKFKCRTIYFESSHQSEIFINAIGGNYGKWQAGEPINNDIAGFDIADAKMMWVILDQLEPHFDGRPTIIVINDIEIFNGIDPAEFQDWLTKIIDRNVMLILSVSPEVFKGRENAELLEIFETKIFMGNERADNSLMEKFGLEKKELNAIREVGIKDHEFLIKRGADSIMCKLDLTGIKELVVLSTNDHKKNIFREVYDNESGIWLKQFYTRLEI